MLTQSQLVRCESSQRYKSEFLKCVNTAIADYACLLLSCTVKSKSMRQISSIYKVSRYGQSRSEAISVT